MGGRGISQEKSSSRKQSHSLSCGLKEIEGLGIKLEPSSPYFYV